MKADANSALVTGDGEKHQFSAISISMREIRTNNVIYIILRPSNVVEFAIPCINVFGILQEGSDRRP